MRFERFRSSSGGWGEVGKRAAAHERVLARVYWHTGGMLSSPRRTAERMRRQNEARHVEYVRFHMPPQMQPDYDKHTY
jgi:hypothetical protein